jgi:flagellar biogenesis protein FliO
MLDYFLRCLVLVPLVSGLAWACLWLWQRTRLGSVSFNHKQSQAHVTDTISLGNQGRLIVVNFGKKSLLVAATRAQITVIAENALD